MFTCPNCPHTTLTRVRTQGGFLWRCPQCDGRVLNLSMLRRRVPQAYVTQLWRRILAAEESGNATAAKRCPSCRALMWQVVAPDESHPMELDACRPCHFVWFDQDELGRAPQKPSSDRELLVPPYQPVLHVRQEGNVAEIASEPGPRRLAENAPTEWWQVVCSFLGMPVEENAPEQARLPVVTWGLALLMTLVTLAGLLANNLDEIIRHLGFIPQDPLRHHGLTLLTTFFVHGGLLHLLGNLYFLLVFGDNTEDFLGRGKFLGLLLAATIAGAFSHALAEPRSDVPLVGASGGISGILMFYALQFRQVRIVFMIRWWVAFRYFRISIKWALLLWILLQVYGAVQQVSGISNVSALAHLGGAAAGVVVFFANRWWTEQGAIVARFRERELVTRRRPSLRERRLRKKRRRRKSSNDRPDLWTGRRRH